MVIRLTNGPRTLARGGLGWGPLDVAIATLRTQRKRSRLYGGGCQPLSTRKCDRTSLRHSTHRL
ncbi:hypothetical protein J0895_16220 [Phormidium pseudopriestleyi FRX01]|uniref:Uncharacterized protein n=1 Tax=Phormidium pseudopriestleyi FRX01 TaxID=1759528 RepID=A0ABS3FUT4_9CYAN|nr:hypothetical protein [Phormidium pseudopriestleyi]MBO0350612.1 hypothetical protein [Phormidium pseudopriestleyi FRX01]